MQDGLEAALAATQQTVETAARSAGAATRELKKARSSSVTGQVRELRKALDAAVTAADELAVAARTAQQSFDVDDVAYLSCGGYAKELLAAAAAQGVAMFEEDDRLLCYPSLLRVRCRRQCLPG